MGFFNIVKVPDYTVKQGDTEQLVFVVKGYDLSSFAISFKGVCPTGTITKAEGSGIVVTAFASNQQTVTITFGELDFKDKQGIMKYEVQGTTAQNVWTLIEGNIVIKPEIIKTNP
jgi:hypothetical protein